MDVARLQAFQDKGMEMGGYTTGKLYSRCISTSVCQHLLRSFILILMLYIVCVAGDAPSIEADEQFASHCDTLQQLLARQGEVYEAEERALKVMISEQVESELIQQENSQVLCEATSVCVCVCVCVCCVVCVCVLCCVCVCVCV